MRQNHKTYWALLDDTHSEKGLFFTARGTKVQHAQMQWLFQGAMMSMTLQQQCSIDENMRADFQTRVKGTDYRIYSPIGFYMSESDFDYFKQSSYIPSLFIEDEWLRHLVSQFVGWILSDDQARLLLHLEVIHANYALEDMFEQFRHVASHFSLFLPDNESVIPSLMKPPEAVQPHLSLVH